MKTILLLVLCLFIGGFVTAQTDTLSKKDTTIFGVPEEPAQFPGGDAALMSWLVRNIKMQPAEAGCSIQTAVHMQFIVEKNGTITHVKSLKACDCNGAFCKHVQEVLEKMPLWQPAKFQGQPVRSLYSLPVRIHPR